MPDIMLTTVDAFGLVRQARAGCNGGSGAAGPDAPGKPCADVHSWALCPRAHST
jgi:hypothetical protein